MATYSVDNTLFSNHVLYRKSLGTQTAQDNEGARNTFFTVPSDKYLRFLAIFPDSSPGFGGDENHSFFLYMDSESKISENNSNRTSLVDYEYPIQLSDAEETAFGQGGFNASKHVGTRTVYRFNPVINDSVSSTTYSGISATGYPNNSGGNPNGYTDINTGHYTLYGEGTENVTLPYFPPNTVVQYNTPSIAGPGTENWNLHIMYYLADYNGLTIDPTNA